MISFARRAREAQAEAVLDDVVEIADDNSLDYIFKKNADASGESAQAIADHDHINRSNLRIEIRFVRPKNLRPETTWTKRAAPKGAAGGEVKLKCLEDDLAGELDDSSRRQTREERSVRTSRRRRRDLRLAKGAIGQIKVWVGKIGVIEDVVEIGGEVESEPLRQLEVLADGDVGVEEVRSTVLVPYLVRKS